MRHWTLSPTAAPTNVNFTVVPSCTLAEHDAKDIPTGTEIFGIKSPQDAIIKLEDSKLLYGPGDYICGVVRGFLCKETRLESVTLELRAIVSTQKPSVNLERSDYQLITHTHVVWEPPTGPDAGDDSDLLPPGPHTFPFRLGPLPHTAGTLPSSVTVGYSKIRYILIARMNRKGAFARDMTGLQEIFIRDHVPRPSAAQLHSVRKTQPILLPPLAPPTDGPLLSRFRHGILPMRLKGGTARQYSAQARIARSIYRPGEAIVVNIRIGSTGESVFDLGALTSDLLIKKGVRARLFQIVRLQAGSHIGSQHIIVHSVEHPLLLRQGGPQSLSLELLPRDKLLPSTSGTPLLTIQYKLTIRIRLSDESYSAETPPETEISFPLTIGEWDDSSAAISSRGDPEVEGGYRHGEWLPAYGVDPTPSYEARPAFGTMRLEI